MAVSCLILLESPFYPFPHRMSFPAYTRRRGNVMISFLNIQAVLAPVATTSPAKYAQDRRSSYAPSSDFNIYAERADPGYVELPLSQIQTLQSQYSAFKTWVTTDFIISYPVDATACITQFEQQFTAYDSWMSAWLDSAFNANSSSAPSALQTPSHLSGSSDGAVNAIPPETLSLPTPASFALTSTISSNSPISPTSAVEAIATSSSGQAFSASIQASSSYYPSTGALPPLSTSSGVSPIRDSFNANASNNIAVYYGQSPATSQVKLSHLCTDTSISIIILAFLTTFFGPGGFPIINFGSACSGSPSSAAVARGATGLLSCPDLAIDIQNCQSAGKKVLLSLGGADSVTAFTSDYQASTFASQLTSLFAGGSDNSLSALRPFGTDVTLDGFDIDNEDHSTTYYSTFVTSLRSALNEDRSKTYYISSAPQCPRPDQSIPLDAMQTMDFVFVQFYNNGLCNVGQAGFLESFRAWSSDLSARLSRTRLFIGVPACATCAGSGYLDSNAIGEVIQIAKGAQVKNFGGLVLWDGAEAVTNGNFQDAVRNALGWFA